jgi:hypothetical protein
MRVVVGVCSRGGGGERELSGWVTPLPWQQRQGLLLKSHDRRHGTGVWWPPPCNSLARVVTSRLPQQLMRMAAHAQRVHLMRPPPPTQQMSGSLCMCKGLLWQVLLITIAVTLCATHQRRCSACLTAITCANDDQHPLFAQSLPLHCQQQRSVRALRCEDVGACT